MSRCFHGHLRTVYIRYMPSLSRQANLNEFSFKSNALAHQSRTMDVLGRMNSDSVPLIRSVLVLKCVVLTV